MHVCRSHRKRIDPSRRMKDVRKLHLLGLTVLLSLLGRTDEVI